ncbi:MAG: hypothetical protein ACXVBZ_15345 [Flavisolibacter sp.]
MKEPTYRVGVIEKKDQKIIPVNWAGKGNRFPSIVTFSRSAFYCL